MEYTKEIKTGILAVVAILILIFGYYFLKGQNLLDSSRTFHAIYADVEGLSTSSPVTINGHRVGQVTKIDFLDKTGLLVVTFTVDSDFEFSKNSLAQIYGGGIIGGKSLGIVPEYELNLNAKSGDTLPSDIEEGIMELVNERLTPLQIKVERAIVSADSLLTGFNEVLNPETRNNIAATFEDLAETVRSLKETSQSLNGVVGGNAQKFDRTFTNLEETSANFNKFSDTLAQMNISAITADIEKVIADFEKVSNKLSSGEGTAGKLLNDNGVYDNLDRATKQMEQLLQDIKLNPKRYVHFSVFGKSPGPYQPPRDSLK
ncbi:MCE family protein [Antarcticibacterium arcticum]|uniref:MCE family protein n=1 Tax=Antarcticibacterium arcticum TaxID=2585771 RepID=A0A5B8YKW1_9FLAO|nr:MlaD family protein [Antarcticibacterium arcticum]QED36966.1 MCE family protein [Antarcticibacterium arcticum]